MVLFFCLTTLQNWQNCPAALTNHSGFLSIQLGFFRTSRGGANNISFIFQDRVFESFEEFQTAIIIDNKNILQLEKPLEILRAGIIDNEPMLKTPWGDKRLADKAVNK